MAVAIVFAFAPCAIYGKEPSLVCGLVLDATGAPATDVKVYVVWDSPMVDEHWRNTAPDEDFLLGEGVIDGDGYFDIPRPEKLNSMHWAYPRAIVTFVSQTTGIESETITLNLSRPVGIEKQLREGITYTDRIVDEDGKPIVGAKVTLEEVYKEASHILSAQRELKFADCNQAAWRPSALTDSKGEFSIEGIPQACTLLIRIQHPDFPSQLRFRLSDSSAAEPPHEVSQGALFKSWWVNHHDLVRLRKGTNIELAVLTADGKPASDTEVLPLNSARISRANEAGKVEVRLQSSGIIGTIFAVRENKSAPWSWISAKGSPDHPVLQLPKLRWIRGRVIEPNENKGIPGFVVRCGKDLSLQQCVTDSQGHFVFQALDGSPYLQLKGTLPGFLSSNPHLSNAGKLKADGDVEGLEFHVPRIRSLAVQVLRNGKAVEGAHVYMLANRSREDTFASRETDDRGIASFEISQPLHASITARDSDGNGAIAIWDGVPGENPLEMNLQEGNTIDGELIEESIGGILHNPASTPIIGQIEEKGLQVYGIRSGEWVPLAESRPDGTFEAVLPRAEAWVRMRALLNGRFRAMNVTTPLHLEIQTGFTEYYFRPEKFFDQNMIRRK